jgi:hypothetical protein
MTAENGMYAQDFSSDYSIDENYLPDETGSDVAGAFSNPSATLAVNGFHSAGGTAFTGSLGAAVVFANAGSMGGLYGVGVSGAGEVILTSAKTGRKSRDFYSLDFSAVYKPLMATVTP